MPVRAVLVTAFSFRKHSRTSSAAPLSQPVSSNSLFGEVTLFSRGSHLLWGELHLPQESTPLLSRGDSSLLCLHHSLSHSGQTFYQSDWRELLHEHTLSSVCEHKARSLRTGAEHERGERGSRVKHMDPGCGSCKQRVSSASLDCLWTQQEATMIHRQEERQPKGISPAPLTVLHCDHWESRMSDVPATALCSPAPLGQTRSLPLCVTFLLSPLSWESGWWVISWDAHLPVFFIYFY